MTDIRKAAEMALDLIQSEYSIYGENKYLPNDVIEALEQALAQPSEGEGIDGSVRVFFKRDGEWKRVDSYEKALNALAQPEQPEALLTFSEVQATITMSRSFVYKEIAEGRINPIKIGKSIRFAKSEIDKWVLSQMAAR